MRHSRKLSIREMMFSLVVLIAIAMLGLMTLVWYLAHGVTSSLETLSGVEKTALMGKDVRYHTVQIQQFLTDASLTHELDGVQDSRTHADAAQQVLSRLEDMEPSEKTRLQKIARDVEAMQRVGEEMVGAYLKQGVEAGNVLMKRKDDGFDERSLEVQKEVAQLVQDLVAAAQSRGTDVERGGSAMVRKATRVQLTAFSVILIGSLLALFLIGRRINQVILIMDDAFLRLSSGDISFSLETTKDEIGKIGLSFNRFVDQLRATIQQFIDINDQISSSTAQNYLNAHDIANEVAKQSRQVDEIAASATQISSTVTHLAHSTVTASQAAHEVVRLVARGTASLETSVTSMQQVKVRTDESAGVLHLLGKRSTEIGEIAQVINDIAAQTNLLALNAAIEAARAGEQGRGFSVVADEVRQLAVKTAQATSKITHMIKGVQSEAQRSVVSMQSVSSVVTEGVSLIQSAGDALQQITMHSHEMADRMSDLAATAEEQSATIQHMSSHVAMVAKAGRNIANRAKQDSAVADTLATTIADELESIIRGYHFGGEDDQLVEGAELEKALQSVPPLFVWDDDLSVGIPQIDEQHKVLIAIINRLNAAMKKKMSTSIKGKVLEELLDYTKTHFGIEEELFRRHRYQEPECSEHLRAHAAFIKTIDDISKQSLAGKDAVSIKALNFLRRWLIEHIKGTDRKYVPFLLQKGVR